MSISVKTPVYEGPLDLLLELIEKRKLLINDISLAAVTDEYIVRVNATSQMPVEETAEFIALAATLLLIKSRSLLPSLALSEEESHDIRELEYRLAVYQLLKDAAKELAAVFHHTSSLYEGVFPDPEPIFIPDTSVSLSSLRSGAQVLIEGFPTTLILPKVAVKKILSIEEMIERLAARVSSALRFSFKEFSGHGQHHNTRGKEARPEIIVSFLALLELIKQGIVRATQGQTFGDIVLESETISTPSYESR